MNQKEKNYAKEFIEAAVGPEDRGLDKLIKIGDGIGMSDGFSVHLVRNYETSEEINTDNSEKARQGVENARKRGFIASFYMDPERLLETIKHFVPGDNMSLSCIRVDIFGNPHQPPSFTHHIEVHGNLPDGKHQGFAVIMGLRASPVATHGETGLFWKPNAWPTENEEKFPKHKSNDNVE